MTELSLNGKAVALKEGVSLKLTIANPCFTDSDSFTYDIEIPVNDDRNSVIFDDINRLDSMKTRPDINARLTVDNVLLLDGKAIVTGVSESAVKVQLLGDRTAYNFNSSETGAYIDKMWLGVVNGPRVSLDRKNPGWTSGPRTRATGPEAEEMARSAADAGITYEDPEGRWVAYPVMNTNNERVSNNYLFYQDKNGIVKYGIQNVYDAGTHSSDMRIAYRTVQPKLWWVCELIAKESGLTLEKADNGLYTDPLYRKIFIANTIPHCTIARMLPHWTTGKFWQYVREAFGLVARITGTRLELIPRKSFFESGTDIVEVDSVLDEFSCETDDDEAADISSGNVEFASFDHDPCDLLDSSITSAARINTDFADLTELSNWWKTLSMASTESYRDTIFKCADGREYAYFSSRFDRAGLVQVNQFAPRITDPEKDSKVELRFVPCSYRQHRVDIVVYVDDGRGSGHYVPAEQKVVVDVDILARPDIETPANLSFTVEGAINGEDAEEDNKEDVIYMGLTGGYVAITIPAENGKTLSVDYPSPNLRERWKYDIINESISCDHRGDSLGLILLRGTTSLGSTSTADRTTIMTDSKMCIKFRMDGIPDTTRLFNIRNRLYACERIEVTVDIDGKQPVMTGYFFPAFL